VTSPPKTVFVVEDDRFICDSITEVLEGEGYAVVTAENGQVALERLKAWQGPIHLIMLDLTMPVKDGFAFRREQELDPKLALIPIVVMTADGHAEEKKIQIGAKDYLKKPFELEELLNVVRNACA
jgi:CheY-like chemotaxis protein